MWCRPAAFGTELGFMRRDLRYDELRCLADSVYSALAVAAVVGGSVRWVGVI